MRDDVAETKVSATVEFVIGSEPIRGRIVRVGESDASFVGWLALLGLLERAASQPSDQPAACERAR